MPGRAIAPIDPTESEEKSSALIPVADQRRAAGSFRVAVVAQSGVFVDTKEQQAQGSALGAYLTLTEWVDKHAGRVFETRSSVDWFVKQHRRELVEAGAYIPREGRAGSLVEVEKFSRAVIQILTRRALEKTTPGHRAA